MAVVPGADLVVLEPVDHVGDVLEQHRRVVAIGDDDVAIGVGGGDLLVGGDGVGLMRAVERAGRAGDIGGDDHRAQVFERDAVVGEPRQVGLDAHRRLEPALHGDLADAAHLGEPLRQHRVGEVGELAQRDRRRGQRQRDDRRVGRVHLRIDRRVGEVLRQRRARAVDRGLHVLRRRVDVAVEIELQRDLADPERARRDQIRERGNLPELPLQRRGHQRRDHVGARARKLRGHLDGREVDLRQRRDRQPEVSEQPAQHHRDPEQRRRDRAVDERRRHACGRAARWRIHGVALGFAPAPCVPVP